jgi:predicted DNA-binding transcriptional regulator AlpA
MRLLTFPELRATKGIGYSRVHIARLVKGGTFPAPLALGEGRIAWLEAEIDGWITEHAQRRSLPTDKVAA